MSLVNKGRRKEREKIVLLLLAFSFFFWAAMDLSASYLSKIKQTKQLKQPETSSSYDLAIETIYADQQSCEIHVGLKNSQGIIPDSVYAQGRLKIKSPSLTNVPPLSLNQVDPKKELNSKKQVDFNTKIILKQSETVEASLESINDSNATNNRQLVTLQVPAHCQQHIPKQKISGERTSSQSGRTITQPGTTRPRTANFSFTINNIAPPKTVYVYNYLPPATNGSLRIDYACQDRDAQGIKVEICDATTARNVLKTMDVAGASGRIGVELAELYQLHGTGEFRWYFFRGKIKFRDGSYAANSQEIRVILGFVNGHYYYQDYATRGIQCMRVNNSLGPVLVSGLTEDDREGRMTVTWDRNLACSQEYPVMGDVQLKFYITDSDGRIITSQSGYTMRVPAGQNSYSFTMKNLIQSMGLSWSARVYYISVSAFYQCSSQSGKLPPSSEWDKESNTINLRFVVPQPLL